MQTTLGAALLATKGYGAPEVERVYARARRLCQRLGDTQQLFPILLGLMRVYLTRSEPETARELGELGTRLAQRTPDPTRRLEDHMALAYPLAWLGEFASARAHFEQAIALYDPRLHHALALGTILRGWTLCENGQGEEGITQIRQGHIAYRAAGSAGRRTLTGSLRGLIPQTCRKRKPC